MSSWFLNQFQSLLPFLSPSAAVSPRRFLIRYIGPVKPPSSHEVDLDTITLAGRTNRSFSR